MKKTILVVLTVAMLFIQTTGVQAYVEDDISKADEIQYIENENGFSIIIPKGLVDENPEEYYTILGDVSNYNYSIQPRAISWVLLGKVLVTFLKGAAGVIATCASLYTMEIPDPCTWAYKYRTSNPKFTGTVKLNVYRRFISGKIPGCQPMYSGPCNAGYWEVKFDLA